MAIISAYVREDWTYTVEEIRSLFSFDAIHYQTIENANKYLKQYLKELLGRKVLSQKNGQEKEDDVEFANYTDDDLLSDSNLYSFKFVGVVIYSNVIAYSYPKYIGEEKKLPEFPPVSEMKQVMQVIEKYSREKAKQDVRDIDLYADIDEKGKINALSVMLYILEDYSLNGEYEDDAEILEVNGAGDICWQKTIDETYPIISNNRPYYVELYTKKRISNDVSFIRRLHAYVVTMCSYQFERVGLTSFYSLPYAEISDEEQDAFGDDEFIITKIDNELAQIFDDRKKSVLQAMKLYFQGGRILFGDTELRIMGTRSFNLVWEEVCAKVFRSQKDDPVNGISPALDYSIVNQNFTGRIPTLVELIEKPVWKKHEKHQAGLTTSTFKPDSLRFEQKEGTNKYAFYILDAKYYCPSWGEEYITGQPGVEDIAKQYLYYMAYKELLEKHRVTEVKNYFLMPKRENDSEIPGYVKLNMLKNIGLGVIEVRMLPPKDMYFNYLNNTHLSLSELH